MSLMSDILAAALTAIGTDVKAIFAKFDATGKLLKANLPALTKADVGLSNVDNTADANKNVASAGKLGVARKISLTGGVTGNAGFDGTADVSIDATLDSVSIAKAAKNQPVDVDSGWTLTGASSKALPYNHNFGDKVKIYGGRNASAAAANYSDPFPFGGMADAIVETFQGGSQDAIQIAYPSQYLKVPGTIYGEYYGGWWGFLYRRVHTRYTSSYTKSSDPENKWVPISSSIWTFLNTTTEPPNLYVDSTGVLRRSTNIVKPSIPLSGTIGSPTNLVTTVSHGQTPANIKNVVAVVDKGNGNFILQNKIDYDAAGVASFSNYFNVEVTNTTITITAHKDATAIHSKPFKLYVDVV